MFDNVKDRLEVQELCQQSLALCQIGKSEKEIQNGLDFYKYFFTNFPDLRIYFKGAQNYTAEDVQKSDRFVKQGQRILLALHILVLIFNDKSVFHAYIRETVNRHRIYKMDPELWKAFWKVWLGYLESKNKCSLNEKTIDAWNSFGEEFANVAINYHNQINEKK